jgi:hypothetical protein
MSDLPSSENPRQLDRSRSVRPTVGLLRRARDHARTLSAQRAAVRRERREGLQQDPGLAWAVEEGLAWLGRAQDASVTHDGGVARHFGIGHGWSASYPETTGYIVPTLLREARRRSDEVLRERARTMLDWLVSIQLPGGGFQGGMVNQKPLVPVTFNTGQILLGLAAGVTELGEQYREPMLAAATWLVETQDPDGCWRRFPTPFAGRGEKTYETHVAWGLIEAERRAPGNGFAEAALRNVRWALTHQRHNGWFARCCLTDVTKPLTHTIGYTVRGILEVERFFEDASLLAAARRTADGLLTTVRPDEALPGRLDADWRDREPWTCLTGNVQVAHSLLILYTKTGHRPYRDTAYRLNSFVRRTMRVGDPDETRGAVAGSYPIDGDYGRFQYLNWATKFAIDSYSIEQQVREQEAPAGIDRPAGHSGDPA